MIPVQADNERFTVRSPVEVALILKAVMQAGEMVAAHCGEGRLLLVTTIVAVNRQPEAVLLGAGNDVKANSRIVDGRLVRFVTSQNRVRIEFQSTLVRLVDFEGRPALAVGMPGTLLKFQRREFFRLDASLTMPVRCRLVLPDGPLEVTVTDMSIGGVLLAGFPGTVALQRGLRFEDARIDLGGAGLFTASLEVRNLSEVQLPNGALSRRAGCMFIKLPPRAEALLQRYVMGLERERRTRGLER